MRRVTSLVLSLATLGLAGDAFGYCPSYTASSVNNTHGCAIDAAPGTNPTVAEWQGIFALVSKGPSAWGSQGPTVPTIGQGCGKPEPMQSVSARFPCELLKAIAMAESSWRQFCVPDRPADQVGGLSRTIISFDCGYGIGQVTSGMRTQDPSPGYDRLRVVKEPVYNLATGAQILASKWKATNCVGDNQPSIIEDWYAATWAYNGLAYVNNPANPVYDANRGVYNPKLGGSAPYQEKVFGWIENPPSASYWAATAVAYPNIGDVGTTGKPPALPEPSCASPTDCVKKRSVHVSSCLADDTPDAGAGGDMGDGGEAGAGGGEIDDAGATDAASEAGGEGGEGGSAEPDSGAGGEGGGAPDAGQGDSPLDASTGPGPSAGGSGDRGDVSNDTSAADVTADGPGISCSCRAAGAPGSGDFGPIHLFGVIGLLTAHARSWPRRARCRPSKAASAR